MTSLSKTYNPQEFETDLYQQWEEGGWFRADAQSDKPSFTISMPPPNATGQCMWGSGHVGTGRYSDSLASDAWLRHSGYLHRPRCNRHRERGFTENSARRITDPRKELGREEVLNESQTTWWIQGIRSKSSTRDGFYCDWSRDRYTMDLN